VEIKKRLKDEYPVAAENILQNIWTVVSDTTGAARNVADHFEDAAQIDCSMHLGNLGLKYAMGICDNHGVQNGERVMTTPGANGKAFTASLDAIKN